MKRAERNGLDKSQLKNHWDRCGEEKSVKFCSKKRHELLLFKVAKLLLSVSFSTCDTRSLVFCKNGSYEIIKFTILMKATFY